MDQNALTVVAPLRNMSEENVASLKNLLREMGKDPESNTELPMGRSQIVHFTRFVVIDDCDIDTGEEYPPLLAFESNFDGDLDCHLRELIQIGGPALDKIWGSCEGYPPQGVGNYPAFRDFIVRNSIPYEAFYIAYRGHTLEEVRQNSRLRDRIEKFLGFDKGASQGGYPQARQEGLKEGPFIPLPPQPFPLTFRILTGILKVLGAAYFGLLVLFFFRCPVLFWTLAAPAILVALVVIYLLMKETQDPPDPDTPFNAPTLLMASEDRVVQNQLTHIVQIKPGPFRFYLLRLVFWGINLLAKVCFNHGDLGGIPTIHFARWVILKESRRLLFFSNFDGSWESYLGDFIDKANAGLTGVWSNTMGFPKTWFLVGLFNSGAANEEEFKSWTRRHQIETHFWYSAHPKESVRNIFNNIAIREGIEKDLNPAGAEGWMERF